MFSQKNISDYLIGTGTGTGLVALKKVNDNDKYLRVEQTELELISLFLKAGLFNLIIYFYLFKYWLDKI